MQSAVKHCDVEISRLKDLTFQEILPRSCMFEVFEDFKMTEWDSECSETALLERKRSSLLSNKGQDEHSGLGKPRSEHLEALKMQLKIFLALLHPFHQP